MLATMVIQLCHNLLNGAMKLSKLLQSMCGMCPLRCLSVGDCQPGGKRKLTKTTTTGLSGLRNGDASQVYMDGIMFSFFLPA
jgi:hypothetical protein